MSMFNEEQITHMESLGRMPLEEKCYCGWYSLGNCYNGNTLQGKNFCHSTKSRADYVHEFNDGLERICPHCVALPGEYCVNAVSNMTWGNHAER